MRTLRLKISALLESAGLPPAEGAPDVAVLTPLVEQQFAFLPQPLTITVEGDEVVLQFAEEPAAAQAEAARLAQKGGKRAAEGDYPKAIELLQRALKLQPSLHSARRDLAMACMESGDIDGATDHLIEVLRLNPTDAWGWVVLGNLYTGPKNDLETGEKFLCKALALQPGDAWALNSLNRYDKLPPETIREITFEAGFLGQRGLNYDDPAPRHSLKSLPGETLTGLQVICLLYAGFKRLNPEADLQLDLNEPFLAALELFQQKGGRE